MKQLKTIGVIVIVLSFCLVGSVALADEATNKDKAVKAATVAPRIFCGKKKGLDRIGYLLKI